MCRKLIQPLLASSRSCARFVQRLSALTVRNKPLITSVRVQFVKVGIVGGSDLVKIQEQLGQKGEFAREATFGSRSDLCVSST